MIEVMNLEEIQKLGDDIFLIDCHDMNRPGRTGCYVLKGDKPSLIETSASPSIPYIISGLQKLEIPLEKISYIIVTHIHLDHAGGAGLLLQKCPNAKIVVHPKGARHLIDPSRLIAGAKAVYGEDFDRFFDPIVPIPKDKIIIKEHEETIQISNDRVLTFYDTPGHANHHFSIHDSKSNGMFTGDTAGIHYHELKNENLPFFLPSTSPNQFDPEAMENALQLYEKLGIEKIFFGHYGMSPYPEMVYTKIRHYLPIFIQYGKAGFQKSDNFKKATEETYSLLMQHIRQDLIEFGISPEHPVFEILKVDLQVSAMGLIDYFSKLG
jgi:glyoxylase-like metal-dependent hydrolase (beta-lactamase superfamily II)